MTQLLRILLIDDNRSDRALTLRELQREFDNLQVQEIVSPGDFSRAMAADQFDAVITDFQLRWTTGIEILETVKQTYPCCPVIMFTNTGTEEIAVAAMKLGLDDYIIKEPNRYIRVPASLRLAMRRVADRQRAALLEIRLQELLNQVKVGIFRADATGRLLEANRAFLELLGVETIERANQQNVLDLGRYYPQLADLLPSQRQEQELQLQRPNGTAWMLLAITRNQVEGIEVIDGLLEDITQRKQTEMALQQLNATLEARVQERTAELEATNQDLEEFAYSVSHDLGAPLRTIQRFAQILLTEVQDLDANYLSYLQRIATNAQQLEAFITDLLTYSRLRQAEVMLEPVSLSQTVADVLLQLDPVVQARQAQINITDPLPTVRANRLILIQVLTNLLSNAIKFVAAEVQPQVRLWANLQDRQVRLWIEDNGIGIALDQQQSIFSPFTRLHSEEEYPGTGIGLAVARKGIERMGGQIGVESQPGQGSRFWIELPMAT